MRFRFFFDRKHGYAIHAVEGLLQALRQQGRGQVLSHHSAHTQRWWNFFNGPELHDQHVDVLRSDQLHHTLQ